MKPTSLAMRRAARPLSELPVRIAILLFFVITFTLLPAGHASTGTAPHRQELSPRVAANDNCATATVINPAALPFAEDSTLTGAANDVDPGVGGCVPGPGSDVVYSFTPAATDVYTIGATPAGPGFDLGLYVVTDCANPTGTCVAGANANTFDRGEFLTVTLNAGTRYFVVVDNATINNNAAEFHFSLRRKTPANETCDSATVIEPARVPFTSEGTTFGAANDLQPGVPCVRSSQSARGGDVVYKFTPADTQVYIITATPHGHFDVTLYVVVDCATFQECSNGDVSGPGIAETVARNLSAGATYYIIVDGFGTDAGDFTLSVEPTIRIAPNAPTDLTATAISQTRIDLAWTDNSTGELGFRIERSLNGFNFTEIATVGPNVTTFSDQTVVGNTTYFYRVLAFNNFGSSDPSNVAAATTPANPIPVTPVINVSPASIDFGSVRVTQSDTKTITIKNDGGSDLVISAITDPGGAFSIVNKPALPLTIASGQSVTLSVRFAPSATQSFTGAFNILSNDPNTPVVTVTLAGRGTAAPVPNLEVSRVVIDFGTGTAPVKFEIRNTGEADLLISSIFLPQAPFALSGATFPLTLAPGAVIEMTVTFAPTTLGVFTSSIGIVSNDPDAFITTIPLKGTSTQQVVVPRIAGLEYRKKAIRLQVANSNIVAGAVLIVDGTQTFTLERDGDFWVVKKSARSTPGNLRPRDILKSGTSHTFQVRNPNGTVSAVVTLTI